MELKGERGALARQHIVTEATRLFAALGYGGTSVEAILQACAISRGGLYHHFAGKAAVFTAVAEAIEEDVLRRLAAAGREAGDAGAALQAGCAAWLRLADTRWCGRCC